MKKYRLCYLLALACSVALCIAYQSRLAPVILLTLLMLPVATFLLLLISFFCVKIKVSPNDIITPKENPFSVKVKISNRFFIPITQFIIVGTFQDEAQIFPEKQKVVVSLPPFREIGIEFNKGIKYRGEYRIGVEKTEMFDLLKLFRLTRTINAYTNTVVIPRRIVLNPMIGFNEGEVESPVANFIHFDKTLFSSLREYRQDDSLKNIHWKLSSKQDELIVKQMEQNVNTSALILCDINMYSDEKQTNCEQNDAIVESALALAREIVRMGNSAYLVWYNVKAGQVSFNDIKTADDFERQFFYFAEMPSDENRNDFGSVLAYAKSGHNSDGSVIIITPHTDETLLKQISALRLPPTVAITLAIVGNTEENKQLAEHISADTAVKAIVLDTEHIADSLNAHFGFLKKR